MLEKTTHVTVHCITDDKKENTPTVNNRVEIKMIVGYPEY